MLKPDGGQFRLTKDLPLIPTSWATFYHTDISCKCILLTNQHHHARYWFSWVLTREDIWTSAVTSLRIIHNKMTVPSTHVYIWNIFITEKLKVAHLLTGFLAWFLFEPESVHTNAILIRVSRLKTQRCLLWVLSRYGQTFRKKCNAYSKYRTIFSAVSKYQMPFNSHSKYHFF